MFDDASMIRQVNQESIVLLGGGRALLMQIAHPQVAAGVAEHSTFRCDRLGRLDRTLRPMYAIVFGTPDQASDAARRIARRHAGVVGDGYRADDPELLLWVHATLVDTALAMYARFVRPLSDEREADYYRDALVVGELLGVPRGLMPPGLEAFREYVAEMVETVEVTDTARAIAAGIFEPRPLPVAPLFVALRECASGLLPPRLREAYGFGWGPRREALLNGAARASRVAWPRLPRRLRRPAPFLPPPV